MSLVMGMDLGTSYFKVAIFDRDGNLRGLARLEVPKRTGAGRCELNAADFWGVLEQGVRTACQEAHAAPESIEALSYSSQANSFLLLDAAGDPLTPLILWPDLRAQDRHSRAGELWSHPRFLDTTGLGLHSPEFMLEKLCWFQAEQPALWARVRRVLTISDYLVYGLTGAARGDAGTASLLGAWDVRGECWWHEALECLGIPEEWLSQPCRPGATLGALSKAGADRIGLPAGIPLAAGGLDHPMAALGAGLGRLGEAADSTGTVLALLRTLDRWAPRAGCCMGPDAEGGGFYQLAFSDNGAAPLERYQRSHAPEYDLPALLALAEDPAKGAEEHGARVRGILEASAQELKRLSGVLFPGAGPGSIVATGGGARSDLWLRLKADLLGVEFVVTTCGEPACLGAAMFAAVAAGWFSGQGPAATAWVRERARFTPGQTAVSRGAPLGSPSNAEAGRRQRFRKLD